MASVLHHNSGILIPRDEYEELTEALATVFRIGARFAPRLIERLDLIDGDADEEDAEDLEDSFMLSRRARGHDNGPGCPIADAGGVCDEDGANTDLGRTLNERGAGCTISDPDCAVDDSGCDDTELELDEGCYDSPEPIRGGGSGDY